MSQFPGPLKATVTKAPPMESHVRFIDVVQPKTFKNTWYWSDRKYATKISVRTLKKIHLAPLMAHSSDCVTAKQTHPYPSSCRWCHNKPARSKTSTPFPSRSSETADCSWKCRRSRTRTPPLSCRLRPETPAPTCCWFSPCSSWDHRSACKSLAFRLCRSVAHVELKNSITWEKSG